MGLLTYILLVLLQGLIIGALARLALPGRDPMSIMQTIGVGVAASLVAGLAVYALTDGKEAPGFLISFTIAVIIVYLVRRSRGGGLASPGTDRTRRELS
jgi:uncharacterized membrane protein YeaQ/YmgE (transglycosylase-associated protein family)